MLAAGYMTAKSLVTYAGYGADIAWAEGLQSVQPTARYVSREAAWVILNSGFRYQVARKLWPDLTDAFWGWRPAHIALNPEECVEDGLKILKHPGKVRAMADIAVLVHRRGHRSIVKDAADPPKLRRLPFIGSITCWHLAKVLGADVVKPDVHLQRAAKAAGHATPLRLCRAIQEALLPQVERLTVIDSVLWRFGEQRERQEWRTWEQLWRGEHAR